MTSSEVTRADLEQTLAQAVFISAYDFELVDFSAGRCTVKAPFKAANLRPGGIIGGPLLMTAADVTMWLAILTLTGLDEMAVTTELKTSFLTSASQGDVLCSAQVLKEGRRLIYGTAECTSEEGKLLTHHTVTYLRLGTDGVQR